MGQWEAGVRCTGTCGLLCKGVGVQSAGEGKTQAVVPASKQTGPTPSPGAGRRPLPGPWGGDARGQKRVPSILGTARRLAVCRSGQRRAAVRQTRHHALRVGPRRWLGSGSLRPGGLEHPLPAVFSGEGGGDPGVLMRGSGRAGCACVHALERLP